MVTKYAPFSSGQANGNDSVLPSPAEQQEADALRVSVDVYRLQERLRKLPLVPRDQWLRNKRADLVQKLFAAARRDRCIKNINPWAASDSRIPPK
jgi:hypothetical protein